MPLRRMLAWPLPRPLRVTIYAAATAVLLWASLVPSDELPRAVMFWDKAQHALAYGVLAAMGLALFPDRPRAIAAYCFGVGVVVELLQSVMGLGRQGDWSDLQADLVGIIAAFLFAAVVRRLRPSP